MKPHEILIGQFAGVAKARELYPTGHPGRRQAIAPLLQSLRPYFEKKAEVAFGVVDDNLVVEDRPVFELPPALEELLALFETLELKAIHLTRSVKPEDLEALFDILGLEQARKEKGPWIARQVEAKTGGRIIVLPEVPDAHKVYNAAIDYMGNLFGELRMGRIPEPENAVSVTHEVSDCVLRNEQAILGLTMIKSFDNYLFNHSVNVCVLSLALAKALGLEDPLMTNVGVGGLLHDVGKTRIPREILSKPGKLTATEWDIMKTHSTLSFDIICEMGRLEETTARCALEHHVQYDQQGYPNMKGKKPQAWSHVVAVADCYDAITTLRSYQKPMAPTDALRIMDRLVGTKLHPEYFKAFVSLLGLYPPGSVVRLDTNEIAVVVENRPEAPKEPKVRVIFDSQGRSVPEPFDVDLALAAGAKRTIVGTIDPVLRNIQVGDFLEAKEEEPKR